MTILDVRFRLGGPPGLDGYLAGHVPGAVFVDLDTELCGPPGAAGRHPLPDPADLQHALRVAGVRTGRPVLVYDGGDGLGAARAWWTLRWAGLTEVYVLDGGLPAWPGPLSTVTPHPPLGDVVVRPGGMPVLDAAEAAEWGARGHLVDVRAPERFRGEFEPIDAVAGHIPGARNVHDNDFSGSDPSEPLGLYCGSGITAARSALAATVAGFAPAVYIGSWSEWITDPNRPVATGS